MTSENVGGKVDVWSEEGVGTEIKVNFLAEAPETEQLARDMKPFRSNPLEPLPTVSLVGFTNPHKGTQLLRSVLESYLLSWWDFRIVDVDGDIVIINDDPDIIITATENRDTRKAFIILSASRGSPTIMSIAAEHERIGGFCRILYKPGGPSRLREILKLSIHALRIGKSGRASPAGPVASGDATDGPLDRERAGSSMHRRNSEEAGTKNQKYQRRPGMTPRSSTAHPALSAWHGSRIQETHIFDSSPSGQSISPVIAESASSSKPSSDSGTNLRVLVVEDNSVLRNLL